MRPRWLGAGAVAVLVLGGYLLSHRRSEAEPVKKGAHASSVPVVVGHATTRDMPVAFNGIGTVTALSVVDVKARVDGQLDKVAFNEGQEVRAGDLLAQIDPRPFEAELAGAEATRAKDEAQLRNVKVDCSTVFLAHRYGWSRCSNPGGDEGAGSSLWRPRCARTRQP